MEVGFHPQLNLFLGSNAQGKTNILEALYCLSTTKSFRAASDEEMIQFGQEASAIEGVLHQEEGQEAIRLELRKDKNKALDKDGSQGEAVRDRACAVEADNLESEVGVQSHAGPGRRNWLSASAQHGNGEGAEPGISLTPMPQASWLGIRT